MNKGFDHWISKLERRTWRMMQFAKHDAPLHVMRKECELIIDAACRLKHIIEDSEEAREFLKVIFTKPKGKKAKAKRRAA